jgi:probable F420-dependent oxidoreductase
VRAVRRWFGLERCAIGVEEEEQASAETEGETVRVDPMHAKDVSVEAREVLFLPGSVVENRLQDPFELHRSTLVGEAPRAAAAVCYDSRDRRVVEKSSYVEAGLVSQARMRVGVMVPMSLSDGRDAMPTWQEVRGFALRAEEARIDALWVCDHLFSGEPGRDPEGIHEGWTVMSALAAATDRVQLGQLVTCVSFRNPGLLAKMATTVDAISGGRLVLGLGAGWYEPEYEAFGYPTDHRVSRLEEALAIIVPLLRGESVTFLGRYHRAASAGLLPPPGRRIPILLAGDGPRLLQLTARFADTWNTAWFGAPDGELRRRLAALDEALGAEGRNPATLRRTVGVEFFDADVDEIATTLAAYQSLGVDEVIVGLRPPTLESLVRLARAIDR